MLLWATTWATLPLCCSLATPMLALDNTINLIHTFRDYLHHHIKCSKAYIHTRMPAKTSDFLKVLNRARPDAEKKEMKTITGKTFSSR
ncbi:Actin-related protein 2/3 complex subunit 2 [Sciurus carolinensis]|uniref:Arp2/3 complex 34 kDa subunit n=1 Tax=Sciurus carolinensis TaxID=30640 RepID=A0AA41MNB0_SCICA|nr:Actin-related protein 2/3 complex subunit 2 [Sciurus carolinensis]